jgi:hypothetical protein
MNAIDTNVLIYSIDAGEPTKRQRAIEMAARSARVEAGDRSCGHARSFGHFFARINASAAGFYSIRSQSAFKYADSGQFVITG